MNERLKRFIWLAKIFLRRKRLRVHNSNKYFFIIGSGRCGSTLLRVILERHPEITIIPEINSALPEATNLEINNRLSDKNGFEILYNLYKNQAAWSNEIFNKKKLLKLFKDNEGYNFPKFLEALYMHYSSSKKGATIYGDKNPYLTFYLPLLRVIFPNAKYIHLIRDGRDVVNSWNKTKGLEIELELAANRWNWALKEVARFKQIFNKNNMFEIKYETLVNSPEESVKKICNFLEIDFSYSLLNENIHNSSPETLKDHHQNSTMKVNTSSIGKWHKNLSDTEIKSIMPILEKRLKKYGYI